MTAAHDSILKADRRSRFRYSPAQRSALVDADQSSGLSGPRFASIHGVAYQTLAAWDLKRWKAVRLGLPAPSHPAFLSLVLAELKVPSPSRAPMDLILPGGAKLIITALGHIPLPAALLRELSNPRPC